MKFIFITFAVASFVSPAAAAQKKDLSGFYPGMSIVEAQKNGLAIGCNMVASGGNAFCNTEDKRVFHLLFSQRTGTVIGIMQRFATTMPEAEVVKGACQQFNTTCSFTKGNSTGDVLLSDTTYLSVEKTGPGNYTIGVIDPAILEAEKKAANAPAPLPKF